MREYEQFIKPLEGKTLNKSKKVFDSAKVTDHHAIIPTGVPAQNLTDMEHRVYDLVARAFIAVFYPDCKFETTTVFGSVKPSDTSEVFFRTSGRMIIDDGWKVIYKKDTPTEDEADASSNANALPGLRKSESGPHIPSLSEK